MKVRKRNVIKAIMGKKYLQLGSPISPTFCNLDIILTHDLYQQHGAVKQNGKASTSIVKEKSIKHRTKHVPCTGSRCVYYPYFKRPTNHDLYYHFHVRPTKFICTFLSKNIGRFCKQNNKKGEKKRIRILERRYFY